MIKFRELTVELCGTRSSSRKPLVCTDTWPLSILGTEHSLGQLGAFGNHSPLTQSNVKMRVLKMYNIPFSAWLYFQKRVNANTFDRRKFCSRTPWHWRHWADDRCWSFRRSSRIGNRRRSMSSFPRSNSLRLFEEKGNSYGHMYGTSYSKSDLDVKVLGSQRGNEECEGVRIHSPSLHISFIWTKPSGNLQIATYVHVCLTTEIKFFGNASVYRLPSLHWIMYSFT